MPVGSFRENEPRSCHIILKVTFLTEGEMFEYLKIQNCKGCLNVIYWTNIL